jgi:hypothetical protein
VVLKETLQRSLGVEGVVFNPKGFVVSDDEVRAMEATVRAMYERTQVHLRKRGIDSVHLYRGIQSEIIEQGVVESWTGDVDTAVRFDGFLVLEEDVPAERIFLYYLGPGWRNGRFGEQFEYLVLKSVPKGDPR